MAREKAFRGAPSPAGNLSERLRHLSPKRQEIIRPVLENPRGFVLLSIRALANKLRTDPATTVRIVQGLGFSTYKDFHWHLHDLSVAYATSLDTMKAAASEGSGPAALVRAALHRDFQNLHALSNSLDAEKTCALARRIYDAPKIVLLGGDAATSLVHHLEYHFTVIGLPVLSATTAGRVSHVVRTAGEKTWLLGSAFAEGCGRRWRGCRVPGGTEHLRSLSRIPSFRRWREPRTSV
jgi:RpiR family carbohydrate utilization transcriptional regulator